jgi:chemotaxis protein histidine kinase CheA
MDIVKATVESLGGHLRIASRVGRGTRFELMLPSSVALVQAYLVRSSGGIFAVPLTSIARIAPMDDGSTVWRDGRRYWSAGSDHVPVASLCDLLATSAGSAPGGGIALLAESAEGGLAGTEVDEILGRREIIVRPLPPPLCGLAGYTGAAVLDDGSIVLVLDLGRLPRS